jgi:autotransporter family porin
MGRCYRRGPIPSARTLRRAKRLRPVQPRHSPILPRLRVAERKSLLLGTALASTLFISSVLSPPPAHAVTTCPPGTFPPPGPISIAVNDDINCVNVFDRTNAGNVISLGANGGGHYLNLNNSGNLVATDVGGFAIGIFAFTNNGLSPIEIINSGDVAATATGANADAIGIDAFTNNGLSPVEIINSGDVTATATGANGDAFGIVAFTNFGSSPIGIVNSADVTVSATETNGDIYGIRAFTNHGFSPIGIVNSGAVNATAGGDNGDVYAISAFTNDGNSPIGIVNSGDIDASSTGDLSNVFGIHAFTNDGNSPIGIVNSGDINATTSGADSNAVGINAFTNDGNSPIGIVNSGDFAVSAVEFALGIRARTSNNNSPLSIENSGDFVVTSMSDYAIGIDATTSGDNSPLHIDNSGNLVATTPSANLDAIGIRASTSNIGPIDVMNSGDITANATGADGDAYGISAVTFGSGRVDVRNSGDIAVSTVGATASAYGIRAGTTSGNSPLLISSSGNVVATGPNSFGIFGSTDVATSPLRIENSGSAFGGTAGIVALSDATSTIVNSGYVSAGSLLAIESRGPGAANIFNSGTIFGFVVLDAADTMVIQDGGTFEARLTSDFGTDTDLFRNEEGGTVHALEVNGMQPAFVNLERFENSGLISMVDGDVGDVFRISNTVGGTDLDFVAGSGAVAVDAFLGPPGSTADNFIIDGDVFGKTQVIVNNTRPGGGVFNPEGIPIVFVPNGQVASNAFFMPRPFDSGLFDWDVYFVPTGGGSGLFELRSFPGGGAHQLPQLLTAAQDIWHNTNETWFDRTADLRVLLNGGAVFGAEGGKLGATQAALTPGLWVKGSGTWLNQDDSAKTSAYGQTYKYDLGRDLNLWNVEGGVDFGKKGVWAEGDALLFGILGGAILGSLDYDQLARRFDINGGEVGGYVTYLSGGLFVDNLAKVDFLEFENGGGAPGLPGSLDATTWGFRTDAGYRFGQFRRGPFVEPLATIAVAWSDIDNFNFAGNSVKFNDEDDVRGRLGLRVGTSREVWPAIVMEPFVIGSVWGNLSGENKATVTSLGTTFGPFTDEPDDVWGEVSTGVNFFSPGANTSLFAKLDVTFGDEINGVSARGGMRYNW